MALLDFMDFVLNLPPAVAILAISVGVSFVTTVIYKYTTNQKLLKEIKDDVKRMQAEARSSKEPGRAAQLQKEMMKRSMQQFSSSTKSMLITLVPLFLLFGWMSANLAYEPIKPGEEFTATVNFAKPGPAAGSNTTLSASPGLEILSAATQDAKGSTVTWRLKGGEEGSHKLTYSFGNETYALAVLVTEKFRYENPVLAKGKGIKKGSDIERITVDLKPLQPFGSFTLLGWHPGWLAAYIIFSLAASMLARKWLKVY